MRRSLLTQDPGIDEVSMPTLVAIARAMERESVQRYELLAQAMERRGEAATAAALLAMREEEQHHVQAVEHWAAGLGERPPTPARLAWKLPEELSLSWDEVAGSALLTPYRAFAIAADNEQRAFVFYTYLAARADDERVMREAERLAGEELRHAALMRRWRRRAYHRDRQAAQRVPLQVATPEALQALLAHHETAIAASHRRLADRLRQRQDEESALLLERLLEPPFRSVAAAAAPAVDEVDAVDAVGATGAPAVPPQADPAQLLTAAQKPLEALSEALEAVMRVTEGSLFADAERAMAGVVARLARIALQTERRLREPPPERAAPSGADRPS